LTPVFAGDTYRAELLLENLDHRVHHLLTVTVTDALISVSADVSVQKGIPVFHWGEGFFSVNVPASISGVYMASAEPEGGVLRLSALSGVLLCGSGLLGLADINGWQGTQGVTVLWEETGDMTVSMPPETGQVLLLSPGEFTIRK
jgi:hypothetical protein